MTDKYIAGEAVVKWTADLKAVKNSLNEVKKLSDKAGDESGKSFVKYFF